MTDWSKLRTECYAHPCKNKASIFVRVYATYCSSPFYQAFCDLHANSAKDNACHRTIRLPVAEVISAIVESILPNQNQKKTMGLWRYHGVDGGKYKVLRRDGTQVEWPNFVIGARDPAAKAALTAYANEAEKQGYDSEFVSDIRKMIVEFEEYRASHGQSQPDLAPETT